MTLAKGWPPALAYDQALLNRAITFADPLIKQGKLVEDASGPIRFNGGGKYVCVYQVSNWIVRCFAESAPSDLGERYRAIIAFVSSHRTTMPFLVEHTWVEQGIHMEGRVIPFLKVPFVQNCQTLGTFLAEHYTESTLVRDIARKFLAMLNLLEKEQVAHGDLDITNILIVRSGDSYVLKLIDYDGMYVPALAARALKPIDLGHVHFQHPRTNIIRHFGPQMDRFSALVLYLSLIAIAEEPSIWENCDANDTERLLLNSGDYLNLAGSANYRRLAALQKKNPEILKCLSELDVSLTKQCMPDALGQVLIAPPKKLPKKAFSKIVIPIDQPVPARPAVPTDPVIPTGPVIAPVPVPVPQPSGARILFTVLATISLFSGLICAIAATSNPGILAVSWTLTVLGLMSAIISLTFTSHKSRGWRIFCLIVGIFLLIANAIQTH